MVLLKFNICEINEILMTKKVKRREITNKEAGYRISMGYMSVSL